MIGPAYVRTMAAYNAEMNRRIYAAASGLSDADRRLDRGAFWGSIQGTLCHLYWGDQTWMARFDGWEKPSVGLRESGRFVDDFTSLQSQRSDADQGICAWANNLNEAWLAQDLVWFSGSAQREMRAPRGFLVMHFFNHQTHHRGQAHAMITAAGAATGDTDLMAIVPPTLT